MNAEIISTGEEIRNGSVIDTNSAYIAEKLEEQGIKVTRHNCVGDDIKELVSIFKEVASRSEIAIVTGGLGPTEDDMTSQAISYAFDKKLVFDSKAFENIEIFFKAIGRDVTYSNRKQAMLPRGSLPIFNRIGTAPGFIINIEKCTFFCLPGVPSEMRIMMTEQVLPKIKKDFSNKIFRYTKTFSLFGIGESAAGELLDGFSQKFPLIHLGFRACFPLVFIKLYAECNDNILLENTLDKGGKEILRIMGDKILSENGLSMEEAVGSLLDKTNKTLAVAESCTGGLIANLLTDVPGSSKYFLFSGVTYCNESKIKLLGVSSDTIKKYGAVHENTAKEMAEGARLKSGADYGISTSGIAGPDGGIDEKPVGTLCIGFSSKAYAEGFRFFFPFKLRDMNKKIFAVTALDVLRKKILRSD